MFLASFDLLVVVDPTVGANMAGGLDASGINDAEAGCFLPPHQFLEHAFQLPLVEVVDCRVGSPWAAYAPGSLSSTYT